MALAGCLGLAGHAIAPPLPVTKPAAPPSLLACEHYRKPDYAPPRDDLIGIVGLGYYTPAIASLCSEVGLPVGFAVDDRAGASGDPFAAAHILGCRGIPLLSTAEFVERAQHTPDGLTLIAGRIACELPLAAADDPYRQLAAWVARVAPNQAAPLHPAALLDRVDPLPCPNRYAVFGFPGSGNVLTQNLVEGLFARRPADIPFDWRVRAGLVEQHFYGLSATVNELLAPLAPDRVEFIPYEFGTMTVSVECGDRAGVAVNVPSRRHHGLQTFPAHARPTRAAVDYFTLAGAPCVAVVRHPLETLLSQANKIARPSRPVLDDPHFLEHAAGLLTEWVRHLLANRDRVCVVRYEDLAARDVGELRRMADWVGIPIWDSEAEAMFDAYLNRNLTTATAKHFYRGGNDKWRGEFTPDHLRRAMAHLPSEVFTAFGYEVPHEADLAPVPFKGSPMPRNELYACLLEAYPLRDVPGGGGIRVCGTDTAMVDGLTAVFGHPAFLAQLAAGVLIDAVPPAHVFA